MFRLDEQHDDGVITIRIDGDVDSFSAGDLRDALRRMPAGSDVVIDLRGVPFMDSTGLGALICGLRELKFEGGASALCVRPGAVLRLLSITGFDRFVPTASSLEEARRSITAMSDPAGVP